MLFDDSALTAEAVRSDLEACIALAAERGIASLSFVFPRDLDGHDDIVRKYGFLPYWGADPTWHARLRRGGAGGAPGRSDCGDHAARFGTARGAARALDISRSMLLMHRSGIRRLVPLASRAYKAGAAFSVRLTTVGFPPVDPPIQPPQRRPWPAGDARPDLAGCGSAAPRRAPAGRIDGPGWDRVAMEAGATGRR